MCRSSTARKSGADAIGPSATKGAENTNSPLNTCITPRTRCTGNSRSAIMPMKNGATIDPIGLAM
jgi:hypothetical protein